MKLRDAVPLAAKLTQRNAVLPILGHLRIAGGWLTSTDLNQQIEIPLAEDWAKHGPGFCVHGQRLAKVLATLPAQADINITHTEGLLILTAGHARFELKTLPGADFPELRAVQETHLRCIADAHELARALRFARVAMGVKDIRYYLNGVHIAVTLGGELVVEASDGHRAHRTRIGLQLPPGVKKFTAAEGILDPQCVERILELAENRSTLEFSLSDTRFGIDDGELLESKLVDGKFPDVRNVIPIAREISGSVNPAALRDAIARVTTVFTAAPDKTPGVRVLFRKNRIQVIAANTQGERALDDVNWLSTRKLPGGELLEVGFNARLLLDTLDAFTEDAVNLRLGETDSNSLCITSPNGEKEQTAVVMPMRL